MSTENNVDDTPLDSNGVVEPSKRGPMEPTWKDGRNPDPSRICTARRTNGEPCRRIAILGGTVCPAHGGSSGHVKAAARVRIERAADRMAKELLRIAVDDETPPAVRLASIRDALDRAGVSAKSAVEVTVGPTSEWETILNQAVIAGGSRAESRAARGFAGDDPLVLEAEVIEGDGVGAAGMLDGAGSGNAAAVPNSAPPQAHSPGAAGTTGSTTGAGGGTGTAAARQRRTSEFSGTPIVSLADAHPDDEPRRNPHKKNRAISPKSKRERF